MDHCTCKSICKCFFTIDFIDYITYQVVLLFYYHVEVHKRSVLPKIFIDTSKFKYRVVRFSLNMLCPAIVVEETYSSLCNHMNTSKSTLQDSFNASGSLTNVSTKYCIGTVSKICFFLAKD